VPTSPAGSPSTRSGCPTCECRRAASSSCCAGSTRRTLPARTSTSAKPSRPTDRSSPVTLPNPWYIDAEARHQAQTQRLLAYAAIEGKEGVLADDHLAVKDLETPGAAIQVNPGGYSILARHTGGEFEAYVGKIPEAVTVDVSPTDSSGERTDLVILRVENPYVQGSGVWSQPTDPLNGP